MLSPRFSPPSSQSSLLAVPFSIAGGMTTDESARYPIGSDTNLFVARVSEPTSAPVADVTFTVYVDGVASATSFTYVQATGGRQDFLLDLDVASGEDVSLKAGSADGSGWTVVLVFA